MKGERIIAEILSIIGLLIYCVMLQHLYSQLMNKPDTSWLNQGKAWWVTRHSRAKAAKLAKVWDLSETATEPTPGN